MIVIALRQRVCRDAFWLVAVEDQPINSSVLVEQERGAITRPVGRLEMRGRYISNTAISGSDRNRLKRAVENRLRFGFRRWFFNLHVRKNGRLLVVLVMRANAD